MMGDPNVYKEKICTLCTKCENCKKDTIKVFSVMERVTMRCSDYHYVDSIFDKLDLDGIDDEDDYKVIE